MFTRPAPDSGRRQPGMSAPAPAAETGSALILISAPPALIRL